MASVDRIRKARGTSAAAAVPGAPPEKQAAPADDLNNANVQERIQHPPTIQVTVAGLPIMLHPLPALNARAFTGLAYQIISESAGSNAGTALAKMTGIVAENQSHLRKLCEYAARSTFPTAKPPKTEEHRAETDRFFEGMTFREIGLVWDALLLLNDVGDVISGKK